MGSCLVIPGVWGQQSGKVGLPPGHGEQQDRSPSRGLLAPRVRWGGSGWTDAFGLGEGPRGERSLEPSLGGRGKARWVIDGLALRGPASFSCSFVKHGVRV